MSVQRYHLVSIGLQLLALALLGPLCATSLAKSRITLIEVSAKNGGVFDEKQVDERLQQAGIRDFTKFLVVSDRIYHVIGVSRGGRLTYVENGTVLDVNVAEGRWFEAWEEDAIAIGKIAAETMSDAETPPGMRHYYGLGSVVRLGTAQTPYRVIGLLDLQTAGYSGKIFAQLWRVQADYGRHGQISSVLIRVDPEVAAATSAHLAELMGPQALTVTYVRKTPPK